MYLEYFNFREEPFSITPDPKYFFLSTQHEEVIESLLYGISHRKGFMALIGDIGTGKTTTCRALLNRLDKNTDTSVIFNPMLSVHELLEAINQDFGNKTDGCDTVKAQIDTLNDFLLKRLSCNKNAIVLIDEAQNLSVESMEMMRLLSNLETETTKLLQIIFVGQRELADKLATPDLRQLNQRIGVRCFLSSLSYQDTCQYVIHRLQIAAFSGLVRVRFEEKALRLIYEYTSGTPRLINMLCDRTLLQAYSERERLVKDHMVSLAAKELEGALDLAAVIAKQRRPWQFWKWFNS